MMALILLGIFIAGVSYAITDTYIEDFDGRSDGATIEAIDSWSLDQGTATNAITQSTTIYTGSGNALQLTGATTCANVSRSATYGAVSPCWIEYMVYPGAGAQTRDVPTGKIASVTFDHTGTVFASDGSSWSDTEESFTAGTWYTVLLKLDFDTHLYDIYVYPTSSPDVTFSPDKEDLAFIDTTISSLSQIGFEGTYNDTLADDTGIDNLIVHFVEKLAISTAAQTLAKDEVSDIMTVQLQSSLSEAQTAWKDITLEISSSSSGGEFSLDSEDWNSITVLTISENAQEVSFYYKDSKVGKPVITISEYPDSGWDDATQEQEVAAAAAGFDISCETPQVAGEYFNVVITAQDEDSATDESYSGEAEITVTYTTPSSGTMAITPSTATEFEDGVQTLSIMYPDCGNIEIVVTDTEDSTITGNSGEVLFIPASFGLTASTPQVVSREFSLTATAYNALGATTPNYLGPAGFTITTVSPAEVTGAALTPVSLDSDDFVNGIADLNASYNRWGTITLEVYDTAYPTKTGTTDEIEFQPAGLSIALTDPPGDREFYYIGEEIEVTISVVDDTGTAIPNYEGIIDIGATLGLDLPDTYTFTLEDEGSHIFLASAEMPGIYLIDVSDATGLTAEVSEIDIRTAVIEVISTTAPVGTTEVVIELTDEEGEIITEESSLTITVELEEEVDNNSAYSPALTQSVTFTNGIAKLLISNTQAEDVTIIPKVDYDFKIKDGTVTFGRIAKSGIGALLWLELKD